MSAPGGQVGKKRKRWNDRNEGPNKRRRGRGKLTPEGGKLQGALISFDKNKKRSCFAEMFTLFEEYTDALVEENAESGSEEEDLQDMDLASAISAEVEDIKASSKGGAGGPHASILDVTANCMAFMAIKNVPAPYEDAVEFWRHVYSDIRKGGKPKTLFVHRVIPVQAISRVYKDGEKTLKDLEEVLKPLVDIAMNTDAHRNQKYCVELKRRNCTGLDKAELHRMVAGLVDPAYGHTVDFRNPSTVIVVEVVCTVCCVSVIRDFDDFNQFKFRFITKGKKEEVAKTPAKPLPASSAATSITAPSAATAPATEEAKATEGLEQTVAKAAVSLVAEAKSDTPVACASLAAVAAPPASAEVTGSEAEVADE